jgi:hypothetical protein
LMKKILKKYSKKNLEKQNKGVYICDRLMCLL